MIPTSAPTAGVPTVSSPTPPPNSPDTPAAPSYPLVNAWQSARVLVNGLAVRTGPGASYPLVAGYRWDAATDTHIKQTDAVRVDDGYFLWIEDGPVVINGTPWYHVGNSMRQADGKFEDLLAWGDDDEPFLYNYGWLAGGDERTPYLIADEPPPPPPGTVIYGDAPDPIAVVHGTGDTQTDTFDLPGDTPIAIRWYAAATDGGSCTLSITLAPAGVVLASEDIEDWGNGDESWPRDATAPGAGMHWIEVDTDCSWSLRVMRIVG